MRGRRRWPAAIAVLALAAPLPAGAAPTGRWPEPQAYRLALTYAPASRVLSGVERIDLTNTGPAPLPAVWLRLWPNGWRPVGSGARAGGCSHPRATVAVEAGGRAGARAVSCSALQVLLPAPLQPGASARLGLRFRVRVPHAVDRFGESRGTAMIGNAIPILAVASSGGWELPRYSSVGESFYSLAARWDATLRLPAGYRAASTGAVEHVRRLAGGGTEVAVSTAHARDFGLAVGRFQVVSAPARGTRVRVFVPPSQPLRVARGMLLTARRAVAAYSRWGPYGSRELDVVVGGFSTFGGMEYPELVLSDAFAGAVVHEVAHQWFYGIVGNDQRNEPWLDESFASYAEETLAPGYPCNPAAPLGPWPGIRLDAGMAVFDAHPSAYSAIYAGGSCALRVLRRDLGTARFDALLRTWVAANRFGVATTADFIAALRAAAPARVDVDGFLRLARLGPPRAARRAG
jgi:hypothetical protein